MSAAGTEVEHLRVMQTACVSFYAQAACAGMCCAKCGLLRLPQPRGGKATQGHALDSHAQELV